MSRPSQKPSTSRHVVCGEWNDLIASAHSDELTTLAAQDALPLRVDAYLALNEPAPSGTHLGDWYRDHDPVMVGDYLRVRGVKVTA